MPNGGTTGGGGSFNGGTITGATHINTDNNGALLVSDATGGSTYLTVDTITPRMLLAASPSNGHSVLKVDATSLTFTDESGEIPLDIEGGFTSLGPAGELLIASGQVFATLPTADPHSAGQLYSVAGVVHVSVG